MKSNHFHASCPNKVLQKLKIKESLSETTLEQVIAFFRAKKFKPQALIHPKHRKHTMTFDKSRRNLDEFFEKTHENAEGTSSDPTQKMIAKSLQVKMPPGSKRPLTWPRAYNFYHDCRQTTRKPNDNNRVTF